MIIKPRIRGHLCTTAHPQGSARYVAQQLDYIKANPLDAEPKRVLVIGGSAGYGLASRIALAFGCGSSTLSVSFEREPTERRTASAGWYNNYWFEAHAASEGLYAETLNGDAFTLETKQQVAGKIADELGQVDLLIYSLAAPRRYCERREQWVSSVLKPLAEPIAGQQVDTTTLELVGYQADAASAEEVDDTVFVMGGSDWQSWVEYLQQQGLLADGFKTLSFSYLGGELTEAVYGGGTIGQAKQDLELKAQAIQASLENISGSAQVAVLKAIVTQSSAAIPSFSLYISLLYQVMKEQGVHENCIQQIHRLLKTAVFADGAVQDQSWRVRFDELELAEDVQQEVRRRWQQVSSENLAELADLEGYQRDFLQLFGFGFDELDYEQAVEPLPASQQQAG